MLTKRKYVFVLLIIISVLICVNAFFKCESIVHVKDIGGDVTYFTGKFFNYDILGMKYGHYLKGFKIMKITRGKIEIPGVLTIADKKYISCIIEDSVNIYTVEGEIIESYKVGSVVSSCISDMDNDVHDELLLIVGGKGAKYGQELVVLSFDGKFKEILRQSFINMNPWKIQTADVDGDGKKEISVGVYKTAKFHPVMAKRPYLYNWNGTAITPKWRGSRLSRPFDDYIFTDIDNDGMDEIISIEILSDGKKVLNSYNWKGFGFEGIGESRSFEDISDIKKGETTRKGYEICARVKEKNIFEWVIFYYSDGKLVMEQ